MGGRLIRFGVVVVLASTLVVATPAFGEQPRATQVPTPRVPASTTLATTTPTPVKPTITFTAVGDMMFDSAPGRLVSSSGPRAPFTSVRKQLRYSDVTVGNLECALSKRGHPWPNKTFTFRGNPSVAKGGLKWAGFDLIAQGNNHARDWGDSALRDTIKALDSAGLAHAGAGTNRSRAWKPAVIKRRGATIAYLSFSQISPSDFAASSSRPGTAYTMNRSAVNRAIKAAHKKYDYVVVSFHWGIEKQYSPTSRQITDGRSAINSGADVVLSHHPHVIEGVEFYKRGMIAYSLGNFVFSPGSNAGRDTMILKFSLGPKGVSKVRAIPVYIGQNGRPVVKTGGGATRILSVIRRTSRQRGTHVSTKKSVAYLTR